MGVSGGLAPLTEYEAAPHARVLARLPRRSLSESAISGNDGPVRYAPFPSSQRLLQNGSDRSRARFLCAACEPLTDRFRSDTQSCEGKGAGSQGACPLAEYEAAPHGAPQRAG